MHGNSCRICLSSNGRELVELFNYESGTLHANKLSFCAGVEIRDGDQLPQKICVACLKKVEAACEIKEKCIETDQLLRRHLKPEPEEIQEEHLDPEIDCGVSIKIEPNPDWFVSFDSHIQNEIPEKAELFPPRNIDDDDDAWTDFPLESVRKPKPTKPKVERTPRITTKGAKPKQPKLKPRDEDFKCLFCKKVFPKIIEKTKHMKAEHAGELVCRICNKKRGTVNATENCMKDHLYGYNYLCQICAKPFRKKSYLDDHIRGVHTQKSDSEMFACDLCGTKLKYKANMQRHMRTVHMEQKIPCPHTEMCPDVFYTTANSLKIHLYRVHNLAAPISCGKCNAGFSNASELNAHLKRWCTGNHITVKRKQNVSLKKFYDEVGTNLHCKFCPKILASKKHFADHFQGYHRDNKTCTTCEKTFSSFISYRRHMKVVHDKIRKFHCEHPGCGKTFSTKGILISHINTHTGEKPFACVLCNFRTGDWPTLFKHKKKMHSQQDQ